MIDTSEFYDIGSKVDYVKYGLLIISLIIIGVMIYVIYEFRDRTPILVGASLAIAVSLPVLYVSVKYIMSPVFKNRSQE